MNVKGEGRPIDWAAFAGMRVLWSTYDCGLDIVESMNVGEAVPSPNIFQEKDLVRELVHFTRRLGRNAAPEILAQHLFLKKYWESNILEPPAAIALKAFINTLLDFDDFVAAERKKLTPAETPATRPVPIEETTLEPSDGPGDTW
ncbi:hypothetical protein [Rhizobium sp. ICMP 5592]|uniref:hypothetical protein n=1 Tax=Rhizobium sp. ICMP 5592 TaxID=2292445 RepID=UPI001297D574|nr:hypothetical protein [Rhizobium sp. ICMP 5592]MQB43375.1 hypothetical protein [Rhizobium sp. ICMP 5592]